MAILMDKTITIMIDISLSIARLVMGDRERYDDEREIEELRFSESRRPSTDDAEIGISITQSHRRRIGNESGYKNGIVNYFLIDDMLAIDDDAGVVLFSVHDTCQSLKTCIIEFLCSERSAIEEDYLLVVVLLDS